MVGGTIAVVFFVFAVVAGIVTWFFVLAQDSRLVAEEESSRQNTLLLKEIAAHSRTDAALQKAKESAEAANQAKSRYVVGLSHELRTPLNAVLGYAQILERDEAMPAGRKSSIQTIRRSAEHLSGLIDGLLDISRIEAGRLQVYSNEINIHDFLDQIVDMFRLQAEARGLEFRHRRSAGLPQFVRTDEKRLRQILVNLLSNAIKFTDSGFVDFEVGYRMQVATFRISDSGHGIPQDELKRIFEPFVRGEAERNRLSPGIGLGLTITKLLTETLGGEITVTSELGQGSTFQARLMLARVERATAAIGNDRKITGYVGSRRTIMVVDDNVEHREMMRELLSPLDFTVLTAVDGPDCLTLTEAIRPDLFFIDILMPGMSGWDVVQRLRAKGQAAPILMLSANVGDGAGKPDTEAGHNDSLAKPFSINQLLDKIAAHLDLEWVREEPVRKVRANKPKVQSPGTDHLRELLNLGQIGHVRGIDAKLKELETEPANAPLVEMLRARIEAFDLDGYRDVLESVSEHD